MVKRAPRESERATMASLAATTYSKSNCPMAISPVAIWEAAGRAGATSSSTSANRIERPPLLTCGERDRGGGPQGWARGLTPALCAPGSAVFFALLGAGCIPGKQDER